jgi:hypothetical protein
LVEQVLLTPLPKSPLLPNPAFANAAWFQESYTGASGPTRPAAWFQESYTGANGPTRPTAWFAFGNYGGQKTIVYSRQCLSNDVCLSLQRWPLQKDSP